MKILKIISETLLSSPRRWRYRLGFTLMELLVVISIIGILAAVGTAAYSTAQKKGRDGRRKGDMKAIQNALEQQYALNGTYSCTVISGRVSVTVGDKTVLVVDPKNSGSYVYSCSCTDGSSYSCTATLEDGTTFPISNLQ